jgi:hypothetical protein
MAAAAAPQSSDRRPGRRKWFDLLRFETAIVIWLKMLNQLTVILIKLSNEL